MVTNPMRGSRTSLSRRRDTSAMMRSESFSVRVLTALLRAATPGSVEVLHVAAEDLARHAALHLPLDRGERLLERHAGRGDPRDAESAPLPEVLVVHLGHRDVVVHAQTVFEAAKDLPLLLQGGDSRQVDLNDADGHIHRGPTSVRLQALGRDLLDAEGFDEVPDLDVVEVGQ